MLDDLKKFCAESCRSLLLQHQIKQFARRLPKQLLRDYGGGEFYTPAQVEIAVTKSGLNPKLIIYAYAMWLQKSVFESRPVHLRSDLTYEDARSAVLKYVHDMPSEVEFSRADRNMPL